MSYKQVVITRFGGPQVLEVVSRDALPVPQTGEVRVRTLATSACFTDTMIRKGIYPGVRQRPPFVPGYDLLGEVQALGPGVTGLWTGQRVAALTVTGAYSEYVCLPARECVPVPAGLDAAQAVSLVLSYMTAYQMLVRVARVQAEARILVHGASGAVGSALLQLGALQGLEIYATAAAASRELIASLGATPIDYRSEDFVERIAALDPPGVDAVFDGIGGSNFRRSFSCLRMGGRLVAYGTYNSATGREGGGMASYFELMFRSWLTPGKSAAIYSITALKGQHFDWFRADLLELLRLLGEGQIKPLVAQRLPLTEAAQAHALLEGRGIPGKIVLVTG